MCGINNRPVDVRPLQDRVQQAADRCSPEQMQGLSAGMKGLDKQVDGILRQAGAAIMQAFQSAFDGNGGGRIVSPEAPQAGCLRPPSQSQDLACAPAGKGLQTNPPGWPEGSVRTAGGYTVVPEGKDAAWKIFGPEQNPGDKPVSRIWGDPHVDEADGQRWDFTKSSSFRLPDGTLIDAKTTSETGKSVTQGLNIVNGSDRVSIDGINGNKPTTSEVSRDGFDYRARLMNESPNRDVFVLGGTNDAKDGNDRVQWARERGGLLDGVIGGTIENVDGKNSYGQKIDTNRQFVVDASLRPDPVTNAAAWGNMIRNEIVDSAGLNLNTVQLGEAVKELKDSDALERFKTDSAKRLQRLQGNPGALNEVFGRPNADPRAQQKNPFEEAVAAATQLFSMMFQQLEMSSAFGNTQLAHRNMFV